jgi:GT2 family glycosyltransferase
MSNSDPHWDSAAKNVPKVSVIVPTYNTSQYIAETLDSVFAQTFEDYEVIVINDGSPDTPELEKALQPYRDRILYLKQENRGPSAARNLGIRHSRGEFLAFLDSDDAWAPQYLTEQMRLIEQSPGLDAVYSDVRRFSTTGEALKTFMETCPSKGPVTFESLMTGRCQPCASFMLVRGKAVLEAGHFDENFRRSEDYDLWLRILHQEGKISYQKRVLGRALVRHDSLSSSGVEMSRAAMQVLKKLEGTLELSPRTRRLVRRRIAFYQAHCDKGMAKEYLAQRDYDQAKKQLARANHFFKSPKLALGILGLKLAPGLVRSQMLNRLKF